MLTRCFAVLFVSALFNLFAAPASAQTKLLRFPDVHGDKVVFCYAGDLWIASTSGGTATRLTAHPGLEIFPKFSPDGQSIAFTGQYDGDEQVYVMPVTGGVPQQLTYYPARGPLTPRWGWDNQVYDWAPDGKSVLFRSLAYSISLSDSRLFVVPVDGGLPEPLPMPESGAGDFSPDGRRIVYSPVFRDFRAEKRYEGGWANDLYLFDLATHDVDRVTDHPRADRDPMWIGDHIYFASDRDGYMNLFGYDIETGATRQLTRGRTWDIRWPSDDGRNQIVYELNGELEIFAIDKASSRKLSIRVPDDGVSKRPARVSAADLIEDFELSPKGERALVVARGDIFTMPIERGPTRNLTNSSNAHDKRARWSPDGRRIAFISDRDGEEEVYVVPQDGSGPPVQLTDDGQAMRYAPEWSPTGNHLAVGDKDGKLFVLDVASKALTEVADEARGRIPTYVWSPDGRYLAFPLTDPSYFGSIYIWSLEDRTLQRVTDEFFNEFSPAWDPEGKYLYFLADREYAPQLDSFEWNYVVDRETAIYAVALRKDVPHPFPPQSDEVTVSEGKTEEKTAGQTEAKSGEKTDKPAPIRIDFDGLDHRIARVPVPGDNYNGLSATKGQLLFVRSGADYYGRDTDRVAELQIFTFSDRKATTLASDVSGYALSSDGTKVLVRQGRTYKLFDAKPDGKAKDVSTSGLMVDRVPAEEWRQIFDEVWRRFRDFFYVENMHGYDWGALGDRYRALLEHVAHRSDLNYVMSEMIAELTVSHAYIAGGDWEAPERPRVALPGAEFKLDRTANRYRIATIFRGDNAEAKYRAPLTEIGVDVAAGDYVLQVDGTDLLPNDSPYRLLRYKADRPVELTVNSQPTMDGARRVKFLPVTSETDLRYLDMIERNRRKVGEMSGGRIGYIHLPDMGAPGIQEFVKWFYGQIRKEGLVIDVRGNGGGNVSQMVIERLSRRLLGTRFARTYDDADTYPSTVFYGHMACILDEDSASDGDIFPYRFREAGLGPLIGKRSWGGVIGITNHGPLIDGATVNVPQFGTNGPDGRWIIEGHGVDPDIIVENDPKSVIGGRDPQLERAVEEVMRKIREQPKRLPTRPADPVKTPGQ